MLLLKTKSKQMIVVLEEAREECWNDQNHKSRPFNICVNQIIINSPTHGGPSFHHPPAITEPLNHTQADSVLMWGEHIYTCLHEHPVYTANAVIAVVEVPHFNRCLLNCWETCSPLHSNTGFKNNEVGQVMKGHSEAMMSFNRNPT